MPSYSRHWMNGSQQGTGTGLDFEYRHFDAAFLAIYVLHSNSAVHLDYQKHEFDERA